ncbi:hypothetical protein [Shouchella patagoniensis]|uniref:hypothetical protein n=1 Tax=Shouchella patagoniensis TaxID=228576 RepID=UPI000995CC78|nr:hypothetical protein [Shouchella patagoniensis]
MYSFRRTWGVFFKTQPWIAGAALLVLLSYFSWNVNKKEAYIIFVFLAEMFAFLLALLAGFKTKKKSIIPTDRGANMLSIEGFFKSLLFTIPIIGFWTISMSQLPRGDDTIHILSAFVLGMLMINGVFAFASLVFPSYIVSFYLANVYDKKQTITSEGFRYLALYFYALNGEVQIILSRFPFLIQRIMGVLFLLVIIACYSFLLLLVGNG